MGRLGRRKPGSHSNVQRIEDELADRFKDAINEGEAYSIKEIFDMIDEKGRGTLTQRELENAFRKMNVKLSRSMCNKVFDDLDKDGNGTVDVEEFIDFCREHGYKVKSRDRFGNANSSGNKDRSVKTLLKSVTRDVKKMKNKNDFIDHIESNGGTDGFVRRADFENSLREMDFKLSITEAKLLSRHYESQENRGKVDYDTFLEEIGIDTSSYNSTNNLLAENLEEKLEQAFIVCADTGTLDDVKQSFSSQDDREDGFVAVSKFQRVLENELDITLKPQERKIIQRKFQARGNSNRIDYVRFLKTYSSAATSGNLNSGTSQETLMRKIQQEFSRVASVEDKSEILRMFQAYDDDNEGNIRKRDFVIVLKEIGFKKLSRKEMDKLSRKFGLGEESDRIDYKEFLERFSSTGVEEMRQNIAKKVEAKDSCEVYSLC